MFKIRVRPQTRRFLRWLAMVAFFIVSPAVVLLSVHYLLTFFPDSKSKGDLVSDFQADSSWILLAFYSGVLGAVCLYIYDRYQLYVESPNTVTKVARLLFGGLLGTMMFFFLRSNLLIKFLYPKFAFDKLDAEHLSYYSVISFAFVAGLVGPSLVQRIQNAGKS